MLTTGFKFFLFKKGFGPPCLDKKVQGPFFIFISKDSIFGKMSKIIFIKRGGVAFNTLTILN